MRIGIISVAVLAFAVSCESLYVKEDVDQIGNNDMDLSPRSKRSLCQGNVHCLSRTDREMEQELERAFRKVYSRLFHDVINTRQPYSMSRMGSVYNMRGGRRRRPCTRRRRRMRRC